MTIRDTTGSRVRSGEGGKGLVLPIPPPPPVRLVSFLFALAAAVAGFLGFSRTAAAFAAISLGTNVLDYVTTAGTGKAVKPTAVQ